MFALTRLRPVCNAIHGRKLHLLHENAFINGQFVPAGDKKTFPVLNPANLEPVGHCADLSVEDAEKAVRCAYEAFGTWQNVTGKERARLLRCWYNLLVENREEIAKLMTAESGKPHKESLGEVDYGNSFVDWFAGEAQRIRGETIPSPITTKRLFIEKQPIGVVGLITPWNFPHAMITRKAAAALAAGCTCVIKPAEDTPFTALALAGLAQDAGIPEGVINVVTSDRTNAPAIGKLLCESPLVAGISFTGSTAVGKILYNQCAKGIKRIGLELGGNAPFIVYNSAKVDEAVKGAIAAKFRNCGQTCVSANRFLVQDKVYQDFLRGIVEEVDKLKLGDGREPGVHLGPLINEPQFKKVFAMVLDAVDKGAKVLFGGKPANNHGKLFYEPTVLVDIKDNMQVYNEEVFGPVVTIIPFKTEEESLRIANSTSSGLAGYFYSQDLNQIFRVSKKLEVGMCGINEGMISTAEAPFGGIKESGIGREGSHHGIEDYVYYKYLCFGNVH